MLADQPSDPAPLAAQHQGHRPIAGRPRPSARCPTASKPDHPDPARLQLFQRLDHVADAGHLHVLEGTRRRAATVSDSPAL